MKTQIPRLSPSLARLASWISVRARPVALLLLSLCAGLVSAQPCAATPFEWKYTGNLNDARSLHAATLLPSGKVLVSGGAGAFSGLPTGELYDPATGKWTYTGSLHTARHDHTATLLLNGEVLAAGGFGSLASAELYNPAAGNWTVTGSLHTGRYYHSATMLPDGKVLVVAGLDQNFAVLASAELYDPATGLWSATGSLNTGRFVHTATLLTDGRVLVAGGYNNGSLGDSELYDPATGNWSVTASLNTGRSSHTATLLTDGEVLIAGGYGFSGGFSGYLAEAEVYDPASGNWTDTGRLHTPRDWHSATLLPDGKVLVAGGTSGGSTPWAELYDPAAGNWTDIDRLNTPRTQHTATLLPNGTVLAAGGANIGTLASAELYDTGLAGSMHVDGRGTLDNQGNEVTFTFRANQAGESGNLNRFSYCDPAAGVCIVTVGIRNLSITGNSAEFSGRAYLGDGTKVRYFVDVTDNGEPGTSDTMSVSLTNGYTVTGTLTSGDIRIR